MILKILEKGSTKVYAPDDQVADYLFLGFTDTGTTTEVVVTDPSKEIVEMKIEDDVVTAFRYKGDTVWRTVAGGGGGGDTYKVKVDGTDTADYLENKLQQGTNVTITKSGGKLVVNSTGGSGGGVTVYADLATIKAVDTTSTKSGTLAQVVTLGQYEFISTSTSTADDIRVIQPATGSGRWLLQCTVEATLSKKITAFSGGFADGNSSETVEIVENGINKNIKTVPNMTTSLVMPKICVGIGDSNMVGLYLADTNTSYYSQLKTYLEGTKGYKCYKKAVAGHPTSAMLARFHTDVVKLKPDLVVIGNSFVNAGLHNLSTVPAALAALNIEKNNILKMVNMCKTIGADFIIIGGSPSLTPTAIGLSAMKTLNQWQKEVFGDRYVNIFDSLIEDDNTLSALYDYGDNTHYNLAGHTLIFNHIRKLMIDTNLDTKAVIPLMITSKGIKMPNDVTNINGLGFNYYYLTKTDLDTIDGLSAYCEISPPTQDVSKQLFLFQGTAQYVGLQLNASGYLTVVAGGSAVLTTTSKLIVNELNKILWVYNAGTKKISLWLNGVLLGTSTALTTAFVLQVASYPDSMTGYLFSGSPATLNCANYTVRNFAMWRSSMGTKDIEDLKNNKIPTSNIFYYNPMDGASACGYLNYGVEKTYIHNLTSFVPTDGGLSFENYSTTEKTKLATINTVGAIVASATTIVASSTVFHVSGTTAISTITVPYTGFTGMITIIPDGIFTLATGGNIAEAYTAVVGRAIQLVFDGTSWYRA